MIVYNSLAAFFNISGQNSEGMSTGESGGKLNGGITPFEVFLSQNLPDSSINFLTNNNERKSFSIFKPEKPEPDLKRFVGKFFPPQYAGDNNASNSINKAPEFLNGILNPTKNAKPEKILPDNSILSVLPKVSITAKSPLLIDIPQISTHPAAFPLNSLAAAVVLDGIVHENNPEHLERFLELELPAGLNAESAGKTLIIPARIAPHVPGGKPVKGIVSNEGFFLIDAFRLTQLLKRQFPEEMSKVDHEYTNVNNSEAAENQSINPGYFSDTGEYKQDKYSTPVITLPMTHLVEIAQSSRHEIVIDEILEPESGIAKQLTLKPDEVSQSLYKLLDRFVEQHDRNLHGQKITTEENIPESEVKKPLGTAFRIYLKDIPYISRQGHGAKSVNSENPENVFAVSSEEIAPEIPAPEDSITPGDAPKTVEVTKPGYADEKLILSVGKIAEAISNSSKVKYVSINGSDFITAELRVHEETLPPAGQLVSAADYFEKWMHGTSQKAEHAPSKAPLNALPEGIVKDIQNIQVEIALPETGMQELHNRKVYQDEIIYASKIGKLSGGIEKSNINTSRVQSRIFGTTPPQNINIEETPIQFAKSCITQTEKELIITLKNDKIKLSGEEVKNSIIQEAKNTSSEIKEPVPAGSRIIIEKESIASLPLHRNNESEKIKIPVKIQIESQTQPAVLRLPLKTVYEVLSIPPADIENNKTEQIVQNDWKSLSNNGSVKPSEHGDIVFKGTLETYSNTQNNKHVPENNETIMLRLPIKTSQMSIYNSGKDGAVEFAELHPEPLGKDGVNVIPEEKFNILQEPKYKSVHIINKPAPEVAQYPGMMINYTDRLPKQFPVVIEEQQGEQEGMKIQGMFVLKNPDSPGQSAGTQSSEGTGEQLNNESGLQQNQGLENTGYNNGTGKQNDFQDKEANNQTKSQNPIFDVHTEKTILVHNVLEVNAGNEESTLTERPLPVWNVDELAEQMLRQARVSMKKGLSEMRVQLVPPHLGKVLLRIKVGNQKMMALVKVETHEARQLIQENIHQLRESMAERGVIVEKFDVFVQQDYQDYMNYSRWNGYNRHFNRLEQQNYTQNDGTNVPFFTNADPEDSGMRHFGYNTMELIA